MNKLDLDKQQFMKEFSGDYGYSNASKNIDQIRATEFKRLDGLVYLDHAGATLYSELQMEAIFKGLTTNVYGNPHSQSDSSLATSDIVREARQQVLDFCNASPKDYKCIFTSGATAALKLVGEAFPWSSHSAFMYTMENHNSVLGIREYVDHNFSRYALNKGATAFAIDIEEAAHVGVGFRSPVSSIKVLRHHIQRRNEARILAEELTGNAFNLFAFPSECNFSGSRFSLDLVNIIKDDSERVLEGSPYCKGRWMVLLDAAKGCATEPPDLSKYQADFVIISFYKLFGYPTGLGALIVKTGTVAASIADIDFVKRREGVEEFFEDGTISFLSIASIHQGFKILNSLSMSAISRLSMYINRVQDPFAFQVTVIFSLFTLLLVECKFCLLHDREWLLKSLSGEILTQKKAPEMCFINTFVDLNLGILFVESPRCKVKLQIILETDLSTSGRDELGLYAQRYKVRGYDNEVDTWFSNAVGRPCTLLRCLGSKNSLCLNKAKKEGMCRDLETKLNFVNEAQFLLISEESVSDLNNRLSSIEHQRQIHVNNFLLVADVQEGFQGPPIQINPMRFRPNLVISGGAPYAEDEWRSLKIGNKYFVENVVALVEHKGDVPPKSLKGLPPKGESLGGCNRCQMINLNPQEGEVQRSWEPLATLASYRRVKGKILFGILLRYDNNNLVLDTDSWLQVGQEVHPNTD
ncbi:hypothetical protein TEA_020607 [Camellia sinensis var. sinensis]|uniref:MOSC domain-containing protein n=1 Tax=Camellia sinensis var. sinensis TaxID=542762 RepID=A0A4S4EJX9_CAMSN|nr:hypothetical protein TEA_020607 [Camellia sinensis var. sinensis]